MTGARTDWASLGIDLGTSSVKVMLLDDDARVLAQAGADYPVQRPRPGWAETPPALWWDAVVQAVALVRAAAPDVVPDAIGLSGQMHGVVLSAQDGTAVRPAVLWADARALAEQERYRALPEPIRRRLGNPLSPGMAGPILAWLAGHEPDSIAAARWALQPKDWIRLRLTGIGAGEPSDASATLLYDLDADRWAPDVAAAIGVPDRLLPPLLPHAGAAAGALTAPAAAALGLPAGLPVAAGGADTACAALGSGLVDPGTTQLTIGTGVQLVTPLHRPAPEADPVVHCYRSALPTGWYAMAAGMTGGQTLAWVRSLLGAQWAELYGAAGRGPQQDDPVFLPHLVGERTPYLDPGLRGAWTGLGAHHDRAALLYSALEGVAHAVADTCDALPHSATGPDGVRDLWLAGGGTVAPHWRQLLADALPARLHAVDVPGASARGAALLGALAAGAIDEPGLRGLIRPRTELVAVPGPGAARLRERRADYHAALHALGGLPRRGAAG